MWRRAQPSALAPSTGIASGSQNLAFVGRRYRPGATVVPFAVHPNRGKTWISPDAKGLARLLFISDASALTVDIFSMPGLALKGQITGFTSPYGLCSDAHGQIWVADVDANQLKLYSRSGTLVRTLSDPGFPYGCAVNQNTGDLAVINVETLSSIYGDVVVYKNASGSGTSYGQIANAVRKIASHVAPNSHAVDPQLVRSVLATDQEHLAR